MEHRSTSKAILEKLRAGYAGLYLLSSEDMRALREVKKATGEMKRNLYIWTYMKGLFKDESSRPDRPAMEDSEMPNGVLQKLKELPPKSVVILRMFHHFMDDPHIQSLLIDLIPEFKESLRSLIIVAPVIKLPPEVEKEFSLIESILPGQEELGAVLDGIIEGSKLTGDKIPNAELRKELIESALGLTSSEAENAMSLALVRPKLESMGITWDPKTVMEEKCNALKKQGLLEYIPVEVAGMSSIGGMQHLKEWVRKRKRAFTQEAREYGLPNPKGILLVGPPGSGKSAAAKALSAELGLPLLRCDMGKMFGSLVGESERNMRNAIRTAEAVSPCIFWLDEIEKGLAGANAGALDSGVGARMLGTILTWMQEKTSPVFVYATANDVSHLPPELLRKGRFNELWSVALPGAKEREEIFSIHLKKRGYGSLIEKLDMPNLVTRTKGYSGSEIEACIEDAMYSSFDANKLLNSFDLIDAVDNVLPLSITMKEKLARLEQWAKERTRAANASEESAESIVAPPRRQVDTN